MQQAVEKIATDMQLQGAKLKKKDGTEWKALALLEVLEETSSELVPKLLRNRSKSILAMLAQGYMLRRAFNIDFLLYSNYCGYMGMDFLRYPKPDQDWSCFYQTRDRILRLKENGIYEAIGVNRMGILLTYPLLQEECDPEEEEKLIEDCQVFDFLESLERAEFMAPEGILDLREVKKELPRPPL
ncbi:MAG: hypothetical protein ACLFRN_11375 [Halothece sp.]